MNTLITSKSRSLALVFASLAIGLACLCSPASFLPTSPTPLAILTPPVSTPQNVSGLNPSGPWLLLDTSSGLWAVDPDGSGLTQLTQEPFWQRDLYAAVQPGGDLVAVLASQGDGLHGLTLKLISLSGGIVKESIPLTIPSTEPGPDFTPEEPNFEAVRAIVDNPSLAWSPDGTKLAFIGIMDGPTAEVYLYDTNNETTRRVSTDDAQDFWPSWSPDGNYILFFSADSFGTGAGYAMRGAWSARGDGTNVTQLYEANSSGEELVGWRDGQTAVLNSWSVLCGSSDLRLYNVYNANKAVLQEGCFGSAATGSWVGAPSGAVLFSTPQGVHFLSPDSQDLILLDDRLAHDVRWDPAGPMFVIPFIESPMETLSPAGGDRQVAPTAAEEVAMFGLIYAWTNYTGETPGVWISGPGMELGRVFTDPAYAPVWDQDDNSLFFLINGGDSWDLVRLSFPAYNDPTTVAHISSNAYDVIWVGMK